MTNRLFLGLALGVGAGATVLITACSSSSGYSAGSPPSHSSSAPARAAAAVVSVKDGILVGPDGHALYANTLDMGSKITCIGACASAWPPLTGSASAGSDLRGVATVARPDGSTQVTFDGHPLYEFSGDKAAGDTTGDGIADGGGTWHVVREGAQAPSSSASSSGGTHYGY